MRAIEQNRTAAAWWNAAYREKRAQEWSIWKDRRLAKWVSEIMNLPVGARVFLPACGSAHCARAIHEFRSDLVWSLSDYSVEGLEAGIKECTRAGMDLSGPHMGVGDIEHPTAWPLGFDAVILTEVLEHLRDPLSIKPYLANFDRVIVTMPVAEKYIGPATTFLFDRDDMADLLRTPGRPAVFIGAVFDGIYVGITQGRLSTSESSGLSRL